MYPCPTLPLGWFLRAIGVTEIMQRKKKKQQRTDPPLQRKYVGLRFCPKARTFTLVVLIKNGNPRTGVKAYSFRKALKGSLTCHTPQTGCNTGPPFYDVPSEKTHVSSLPFLCGAPHKWTASTNFKVFGLTRPGFEPAVFQLGSGCSTNELTKLVTS